MDGSLQIYTLGHLEIKVGGLSATKLNSRKAEALLVYLARTGNPHPRETLAELLAGEHSDAQANFRLVLFRLRQILAPYLTISRHAISLNSTACWLDVTALEACLSVFEAQRTLPPGDFSRNAAALEPLASLYRGDFLDGFYVPDAKGFEEWMLTEREWLRRRVIEAMRYLVSGYLDSGAYQTGIAQAQRLLQLDPIAEDVHRQLMLLLALTDQRSAALAQYETCLHLLEKELGVEPDNETTRLFAELRVGTLVVKQVKGETVSLNLPSQASHNLPSSLTPFVGRRAELNRIAQQMDDPICRLLTVIGPGGIGKTRLAIEAAMRQLTDYPQGTYFVSLAPLGSPDYMVSAIAEAIGLHFDGGNEPRQQLLNFLREKRMLLLLDNFEHLLPGAELVTEILHAARGTKLLITSRERLDLQSETVFRIDGLDFPEQDAPENVAEYSAVQLFVQTARRIQADFDLTSDNWTDLVHICRQVRGLPLGIVLAAAWVGTLSLAEISQGIEASLDFLEVTQRDMPVRQRSIRAAFDHSWRLLSDTERSVFRILSVFRGGFTGEAAQAIAFTSAKELAALVNKSLLRRDTEGRYQVHELLRQYGEARLSEIPGELDTVCKRHCRYFGSFVEQQKRRLQSPDQLDARTRLDSDLDNLYAAWDYALSSENFHYLEPFILGLWMFAMHRDYYQEFEVLFAKAVQAIRLHQSNSDSTALFVQLLASYGSCCGINGKMGPAKMSFEECDDLLNRQSGDQRTWAIANLWRGSVFSFSHYDLGKTLDDLARRQQRTIAVFEALHEDWNAAFAEYTLSRIYTLQGAAAPALAEAQKSLAGFQALGDRFCGIITGQALGLIAMSQGQLDQAKIHFENQLALAEEFGQRLPMAFAPYYLSRVAFLAGDYPLARDYAEQSLRRFQERRHSWQHEVLALMAQIEEKQGTGSPKKIGAKEIDLIPENGVFTLTNTP